MGKMTMKIQWWFLVLSLASWSSLNDAAADLGPSDASSFLLDSANNNPVTTERLTAALFGDVDPVLGVRQEPDSSTKNTTDNNAATVVDAATAIADEPAVTEDSTGVADIVGEDVVVGVPDDVTGVVSNVTVDKDDVIIDEDTGSTVVMMDDTTIVLTEDEETGDVASWEFAVVPSPVCLGSGWYCIPVSKFYHLPEFSMDASTATQDQQEVIKHKYIDYMQEELSMYIPGLSEAIANALVERYPVFKDANFMVVNLEGTGVWVEMYGVGLIVEDILDISYIDGEFTADMKIYIYKVTNGAPFPSVNNATTTSWLTTNETSVVKTKEGNLKLLPDEYFRVKDTVDPSDILLSDGRCNDAALKSMVPLKAKEFKKESVRILQSAAVATPIADAEDNIIYLQLHNAKIKFQPVNSAFFPFQVNILDVKLSSLPTPVMIGKPITIPAFCIASPFTGLKAPMPSLPDEGELHLIPSIQVSSGAPWFNNGNNHMHLLGTANTNVEENEPDRLFRFANFRIVYYNGSIVSSWMVLIPFLFTAFTTQLQWFILQAESCVAGSMVTAVLLIQNLINSQKPYTGYQNIATQALYVTYVLTGIYVFAVAFMTFINIAKGSGRIEFLVHHQLTIFSYMRFLGLMMTPMYFPILFFHSDISTGEQEQYSWLWPLTTSFCVIGLSTKILFDVSRSIMRKKKEKEEAHAKGADLEEEAGAAHLSKKGVKCLTVEEVKVWVSHSQELLEASRFTKDDLPQIAHKFADAKVDGTVLMRIGTDPQMLVTYVGLAIGDAMAFSDAFQALTDQGSIALEVDIAPRRGGFGLTKRTWKTMRLGNDGADKVADC